MAEFAGPRFRRAALCHRLARARADAQAGNSYALSQAKIFAKVPGEVLERRTNGEEEPYQDWAAVQGRLGNADYTVALLNNSTYSYDCLDSVFRTVLIRSAPFARHNPNQVPRDDNNAWQDQGRQERTFWLLGRRGGYTG